MNFIQSVKLAFKSIIARGGRTFLTMLGIIIGLAAVITQITYAKGQSREIMEYYASMGTNQINVYAYKWGAGSDRVFQSLYDYCLQLGDLVEVPVTPRNFGRIAAQTGKQVVVQHLREAERGVIYDEYSQKENEILTAIVQHIENKQVFVELGRVEGVLEPSQQMPTEELNINDRIKVYVLEVSRMGRGPQVFVSRTHPGLVKRLFEIEVPEIVSGVVQIKSIAREAGFRTKMAVYSTDPMIDAVGSCVGPRGMRVENVVNELKTEKIDIVKWSSDPAEYIANALNPARVISVFVSETEKAARVIVPDNQLSLAIGKEGQNARLAAKLTGFKIDIKPASQAE